MTALSEDDDILAAEIALGVIPLPDRDAALERLRVEPPLANAVSRWKTDLAVLAPHGGLRDLWPEIAGKVAAEVSAASPGALPSTRLRRWKVATAALGLAAALLLAVQLKAPEQREIRLAAILTGPDRAVATIGINAARDRLVVQSSALARSLTGQVPELWVVPPDGRPRSLGVIAPDVSLSVRAGDAVKDLLATDASLAISVEPAGGSPTGQPTGPIVLTGKIVRI